MFVYGLFIGSFLNVIVLRLYAGQSFVKGRSKCPHCQHTLKWYDLIPLLSYLSQLGKCRYCRVAISAQYPIAETLTGLVFSAIGLYVTYQYPTANSISVPWVIMELVLLLIYFSNLIIIFIFDLKYKLIPEIVMIINGVVAISYLLVLNQGDLRAFIGNIISAAVLSFIIFLIYFFSKKQGMGFGDVELVFILGLLIPINLALLFFFLSFFIGSVYGIGWMIVQKGSLKSAVPFGPALILGFMTVFLFQDFFTSLQEIFFLI